MEIFKIGAIDDWQNVKGGTEIEFKTNKARRISFEVLSNDRVEVWCSNCDGEMSLIAVVDGKAEIETTICVDAKMQIKAKKDATTMVKLAAKDQPVLVYERNGNESMTDITPRQRENSEVMHVMRLMQANQKQREAQMMAEINKLKAGQKDEPVEVVEPVGEEPAENSNDAEPEPKVE